jgi:hypothetical protein
MSELTWELLCEIQGRLEAEVLQSLLEAEGIQTQLIQESAGRSAYPVSVGMLGLVQVFVPRDQAETAREILKEFQSKWQASEQLGGENAESEEDRDASL